MLALEEKRLMSTTVNRLNEEPNIALFQLQMMSGSFLKAIEPIKEL